jgi:hypothetical protein
MPIACRFSKENLTHLFLQPAVAVNNEKKTVQFAFISKFSGVNFNVTDTALIQTGSLLARPS